jgi:hypothetical protein
MSALNAFCFAALQIGWPGATPRTLLKLHPSLIHQHVFGDRGNDFRSPAVLEFIAKNPLRQGRMPDKSLAVAEVPLDAGPSRALRNETRR